MSRYTGYNQRGFANSTVAVTRAASGEIVPVNITGDASSTKIYLPLNDNTNDATGNFTISGTASVSSAEAKFGGGSALFNSSSTYLTASGSQSAMAFTGAFTLEMWVYQTATPTGSGYTIAAVHNSTGWLWQLKPTYSRFWVNSSVTATFNETLTNDTWHHLAVVREEAAGVVKFYLNGTLKATSGSTPSTMVSSRDLFIGAYRSNSSSQNFQGYIDDFRILDGVALYTSNFTPPAAALGIRRVDPVSLYLPFDSDLNDDSENEHTVTASGDAVISSTQAKFGGNSLALDGTGDYLTIPSHDAFHYGDGDFTIEMWVYMSSNSSSSDPMNLISKWDDGQRSWAFELETSNRPRIRLSYDGSTKNVDTTLGTDVAPTASQWHHLAFVRSGETLTAYLDGVAGSTTIDLSTNSLASPTSSVYIGQRGDQRYFDGYIDDVRILKGVARYTKNFVPPSQAVGATLDGTNETNTTSDFTALYLPFTADINDDSSHGHTMTAYGNATISSTQSKFGSNAAYFDGSGDYIAITSDESELNIGTEDFTFEAWIWLQDLSGYQTIFMTKDGTQVVGHYYLRTNGSKLQLQLGSISNSTLLQLDSTTDLKAQTWTHVAATRIGSSLKLYIDGAEAGSGTDQQGTRSLVSGDFRVGIGRHGSPFQGYINDLRILKGHAKYRGDFVPHTSPIGTSVSETVNDLTLLYMPFDGTLGSTSVASSDVSLYLPYDSDLNDDSSNGHTGSAAGNATISSSYSKFGGNSLYLDGTGDYVSYGDDNSFEFGSGDFTMEAFIYPTDLSHHSVTKVILGKFSGSGHNMAFVFGVSNTNYLQFFYSASGNGVVGYFTSSTTEITTGQWYHVAVTRKGNTGYLFVDGNLETTFSFTSSIADVGTHLLVGAATNYGGGAPGGTFAGYIDDVRIIKGTALYISSFTAPTSALGTSATAQTFSGGFKDEARNHTITKNGDVTLNTSVKKFGTSSAYFDGTGDYALIDHHNGFNFGNDDFTIEGWFYIAGGSTTRLIHAGTTASSYSPFMFYISGSQFLFYSSSSGSSWGDFAGGVALGTVSLNTWTHLAVTRQGGFFRCFQDGVLKSTTTSSAALMDVAGDAITLGRFPGDSQYLNGYIDDLRIVRGKAIYTEAFTPPESALGVQLSLDAASETYSDNKFLSGVWDMTDVRDKMMKSTWVSNDSRLTNGAGLQVAGHRWYEAPPQVSVTFKVWGAGGGGGYWNGGSAGHGGAGGFAQGTLSATSGTTYNVVVGTEGLTAGPGRSTPTYPTYPTGPARPLFQGGGGTEINGNSSHLGASGGGFSAVFEGPVSKPNAIIVAGGGGGGTAYDRSGEDESGGGGSGTPYGNPSVNPPVAAGGGYPGSPTDMQGGVGTKAIPIRSGSGGGGGYRGGQGGAMSGADNAEEGTGGGGGSGYVAPAMTSVTTVTGSNGTAGSSTGLQTSVHPTASSDPDYTGNYGKGGGYNSDGEGGYVVITDSSGTYTFTSPGTHTVS